MDGVIISGGAGFIGSHLVDALLARGYRVVVIDNLLTGKMANLAHHAGDERLTVLQQDCAAPFPVESPVRYVLHFASPASPLDYMRHPLECLAAGSLGARQMLECAREHGARFLLASTSEVYGDPHVHPQPETYYGNVNSVGPRSMYDEAKRFAEALTMAYHRTLGVDTAIVRIFNTYGPRMRLQDGRAIPNFLCQALTNQPITIYGDGSLTRSFCFITDEVDGLLRLLMSDCHEPVNIGNPVEYTIQQLAERIVALTGSQSTITYHPSMEDDPKVRRPDITRATTWLGWKPVVGLDEGLQATIEAFKRAMANEAV